MAGLLKRGRVYYATYQLGGSGRVLAAEDEEEPRRSDQQHAPRLPQQVDAPEIKSGMVFPELQWETL